MTSRIVPLIMCGGVGTRLWPLSREGYPKQFISLFGQRSTFQETLLRVSDSSLFDRPIIVTAAAYRSLVLAQMTEIGCQGDVLLESARRDSGPAIAAGTVFALRRNGPECIVLALAADHLVSDAVAFVAACEGSLNAAIAGYIVTFGIKPSRPATEYGYISPGPPLVDAVRHIRSFVEKPDLATATRYVQEGYLWNSGNFMFSASTLLDEYGAVDQASVDAVIRAVDLAERVDGFVALDRAAFEDTTPISIDYAVMEKTARAAVHPVSFGWSDVGSWRAVWELSEKDSFGNSVRGEAVLDNVRNCYISSEKMVVALGDVEDLIVVATGDAVLVTRQSDNSSLKRLVSQLNNVAPKVTRETRNDRDQRLSRSAECEARRFVLEVGDSLVREGQCECSIYWVVVRGMARVTTNGREQLLQARDTFVSQAGIEVRLENIGINTFEMIEILLSPD